MVESPKQNDDTRVYKQEVAESDIEHVSNQAEVSKVTACLSSKLSVKDTPNILICDAGYGLPREVRPRREKILAIARQIVNFLKWQLEQKKQSFALIRVVGCKDDATKSVLEKRTKEVLGLSLPNNLEFSCETLESCCGLDNEVVYLSPDAETSLDPACHPPKIVVVGLLIDRRVQPNRSKNRASDVNIVAKRWPLEECFVSIDPNEPLNVDCILEGMQQWWWNCETQEMPSRDHFIKAAEQAIEHHAKRHPSRTLHL